MERLQFPDNLPLVVIGAQLAIRQHSGVLA
jgi:hypothetical protein